MADKDSFKKPVLFEVEQELGSKQIPYFDKQAFDDSVFSKGYDVYVEKALRCACSIKANNQSKPDCRNCGGTNWIFVNKRLTKAVMQSMNKQTRFLSWSEVDRGTVSVTVRDDDKLAFMDRITNLNLVSTYAEALQFSKINNKLIAYTIYPVIVPTECYLFLSSSTPLQQLILNTDYTILDNKIILDDKYLQQSIEELTVSIRYTHFPQFSVLDIDRDAISNLGALHSCEDLEVNTQYAPLPIHAIARKMHYVMDDPNADSEGLFDNTFNPNNSLNILSKALPFSLLFWTARSSAEQIVSALKEENDTAKMSNIKSSLP